MNHLYDFYIFDADHTLFEFDAFEGLKHMFANFDVQFDLEDYEFYQQTNKPLWVQYQNGEISADTLQTVRFSHWGKKLNIQPKELNESFLDSMAEICEPLPNAKLLLETLKAKRKSLSILTNGFTALQQRRLNKTGLADVFDHVIISEQVGFAKPDERVFKHTLDKLNINQDQKSRVLMIGDTFASDIVGGQRAGIETCWLNHHNEQLTDEQIKPTYEVKSLKDLMALLEL